MPRVFISYRRDDSADVTGRMSDYLRSRLGENVVFRDVDGIALGHDFHRVIYEAVVGCRVLVAVIGPSWVSATGPAGRRLDDRNDFVRLEIETALARGIPVIPVLVGRAVMPNVSQLPQSLQPVTRLNGIEVRRDPDFPNDMDRLIRGLTPFLPRSRDPGAGDKGRTTGERSGTKPLRKPATTRRIDLGTKYKPRMPQIVPVLLLTCLMLACLAGAVAVVNHPFVGPAADKTSRPGTGTGVSPPTSPNLPTNIAGVGWGTSPVAPSPPTTKSTTAADRGPAHPAVVAPGSTGIDGLPPAGSGIGGIGGFNPMGGGFSGSNPMQGGFGGSNPMSGGKIGFGGCYGI